MRLVSSLSILGLTCAVAALALTSQLAPQPQKTDLPPAGFDPKRDPAKDLEIAAKQAQKGNRRILLDVGGEWCIWCRRLNLFFKTHAETARILKERYVLVKVNFSPENENRPFLSKYPPIAGYPHLFVLDKDGKLLHSQDTGELETGDHHDPAKVVPFLKKWAG